MSTDDRPEGDDPNRREPAPAIMLELLVRLGSGDRLVDAPISLGLSQEEARVIFAKAAEIVRASLEAAPLRKRWPRAGSLLDWREMTIAEALEILAAQPAKPVTEES